MANLFWTCLCSAMLLVSIQGHEQQERQLEAKILAIEIKTKSPLYTCYPEDVDQCIGEFSSCISGSTSEHYICPCYESLGSCLVNAGCLEDYDSYTAFTTGCVGAGCTVTECSPVQSTSTSSTSWSSGATTSSNDCSNVATSCAYQYDTCTSGTSTLDAYCDCYLQYGYCMWDEGCLNGDDYTNFVSSCEYAGCNATTCQFEGSTSSSITTGTTGGCNNNWESCYNNYESCASGSSDASVICGCYGYYIDCMYEVACYDQESLAQAISSCEESGCTAYQCNPDGLTSGMITTGSADPCETCSPDYVDCTSGQTTMDVICTCYGEYGVCLFKNGCISDSQYQSWITDCEQSCTVPQCTASGAPIAITPQ